MVRTPSSWSGGLAEWRDGDTVFLSVAFTWRLSDANARALFAKAEGYNVRVGGPALFPRTEIRSRLREIADVGGDYSDAIRKHHEDATIASRGCPVGCWFCIVPAMEGKNFTLIPDFPVRPILCDQSVVYERFGLSPNDPSCIKQADNQLLRTEQRDLMKPAPVACGKTIAPAHSIWLSNLSYRTLRRVHS